jgi:hypothetical protein
VVLTGVPELGGGVVGAVLLVDPELPVLPAEGAGVVRLGDADVIAVDALLDADRDELLADELLGGAVVERVGAFVTRGAGAGWFGTDDAGRTRKYSTSVATKKTLNTMVEVRTRTCSAHQVGTAAISPPSSARRCPAGPGS